MFNKWLTFVLVVFYVSFRQLEGEEEIKSATIPVNAEGWRLAAADDQTWEWSFPKVFGPQRDFKTEWWCYTGHLKTERSEWFGYQFTLFRIGMRPPASVSDSFEDKGVSAWRFDDLWMGHFAVTDIKNRTYHSFDRLVRGTMGLGGAETNGKSTTLWVGDWSIRNDWIETDPSLQKHLISASENGWQLELNLESGPIFYQGENGLSRKGEAYGQASWYVSHPQMKTSGVIRRPDGEEVQVTGMSWFDREIASNQLGENQVGWDWFAVQLDTGDSLMIYRMRLRGGGFDKTSHGQWMPSAHGDIEDGTVNKTLFLNSQEFSIHPGKTWKSKDSGAVYPVEWKIEVPSIGLELQLKSTLPAQEFRSESGPALHYWEGSHTVSGRLRSRNISGRAYVELTGYAGPVPGLRE